MGRNNKQGQSKRSKIGTAFQQASYDEVETFLESEGLDRDLKVVNLGRKETILPNDKSISPDLEIRTVSENAVLVRFGCKTSLRERWKQDDRDAILSGPDIPWVELTERENPKESLEDIRKKCANIQRQSNFTFVVSLRDPDKMNEMFESLKSRFVELGV